MSDGRRIASNDFPVRLRALFGVKGLTQRLMTALDRGHSSTEDIMAGRNVPVEIVWLIEVLEGLPLSYWPDRWRDARGADAGPLPTRARVGRGAAVKERARARYYTIQDRIDADGLSQSDVARLLGVSRARVSEMAKRGHLVFKGKK